MGKEIPKLNFIEGMAVLGRAQEYERIFGVQGCVLGVDPYADTLARGGPEASLIRRLRSNAYRMAREDYLAEKEAKAR